MSWVDFSFVFESAVLWLSRCWDRFFFQCFSSSDLLGQSDHKMRLAGRRFIANITHCENHFISINRCFLTNPRFLHKYIICTGICSFQATGSSVRSDCLFKQWWFWYQWYIMNFTEEPPAVSSESGEETIIAWRFSESLCLGTEGIQRLKTTPYKLLFKAPFWILKTSGNNVTCVVWQGDYCASQLSREGYRMAP